MINAFLNYQKKQKYSCGVSFITLPSFFFSVYEEDPNLNNEMEASVSTFDVLYIYL